MRPILRPIVAPLCGALLAASLMLLVAACSPAASRHDSAQPPQPTQDARVPLPYAIALPPGFSIHYYAQSVPGARSMTLSPSGALYVGTRAEGNVYALLDHNQDHIVDEVKTIASGLNSPNGVAFHDSALYVAEIGRILRYDNIETQLDDPPAPVILFDGYPEDQWHGWRYLRIGPDGFLYVPVGAPCNICQTGDSLYGTITRLPLDGGSPEIIARGVRNSVGFDWGPQSGDLWFTDNGRDDMGDDLPPDELNHIAPHDAAGPLHFGFPYCHAGAFPDPVYGEQRTCDEFVAPAMPLGPHVASLGMRFYTGDMFPAEYRSQIFIAEHGSWNRTEPIGYRITLVRMSEGQAASYEVFADGWLRDGQPVGRPVDLLVMPDGSLLVSDDAAGAIYRITYE